MLGNPPPPSIPYSELTEEEVSESQDHSVFNAEKYKPEKVRLEMISEEEESEDANLSSTDKRITSLDKQTAEGFSEEGASSEHVVVSQHSVPVAEEEKSEDSPVFLSDFL